MIVFVTLQALWKWEPCFCLISVFHIALDTVPCIKAPINSCWIKMKFLYKVSLKVIENFLNLMSAVVALKTVLILWETCYCLFFICLLLISIGFHANSGMLHEQICCLWYWVASQTTWKQTRPIPCNWTEEHHFSFNKSLFCEDIKEVV